MLRPAPRPANARTTPLVTATLVLAATLLAATGAQARDVAVDGYTLVLPDVPGTCYLDAGADPADRSFIDTWRPQVGKANHFVAAFTDCTALDDWRRGRSTMPTTYGLIMVALRDGEVRPVRADRAAYLEALASDLDIGPATAISANAVHLTSVLDYNDGATMARLTTVQALTLAAGLPVSVTVYTPAGDNRGQQSLTGQIVFTDALAAANPDHPVAVQAAEEDGLDLPRLFGLGLTGLGLGGVGALFLRWRARRNVKS